MIETSQIEGFVLQYYHLLDSYSPVEQLQDFFIIDNFCIIEDEMMISSLEQYASWYAKVNKLFKKREHQIISMDIDTIEEGYYVLMQMQFKGITNNDESLLVEAKIKWHVNITANGLKVQRYEVIKKEP